MHRIIPQKSSLLCPLLCHYREYIRQARREQAPLFLRASACGIPHNESCLLVITTYSFSGSGRLGGIVSHALRQVSFAISFASFTTITLVYTYSNQSKRIILRSIIVPKRHFYSALYSSRTPVTQFDIINFGIDQHIRHFILNGLLGTLQIFENKCYLIISVKCHIGI